MGTRTLENRIKAWTGTVHYAKTNGHTVCGAANTSYSRYTLEDVTCLSCITISGSDEFTGYVDPAPSAYADQHAKRRAQERAERRVARG